MWPEMGNFWTGEAAGINGANSMPAHCPSSYLSIMNEVHVLVVDHDTNHLINTAHLLELCQYKVNVAELASRAIQMLLIGKLKFDFILADLNSPDLHGYKLLQQAVIMNIPLIVMSTDDSALLTLKALENGAFLCIKKPTTMDALNNLWLHMAREKIRGGKNCRFMGSNYNAAVGGNNIEFIHNPANPSINFPNNLNNNINLNMNAPKKDNYAAGISGVREGNYRSNYLFNAKIKRKACTEWTKELHDKFMDAVRQLGEGRCFPKEILDLMNVPGLTRMQVASHLQKCRNDNWRSPDERISNPNSQQNDVVSSPDQHERGAQQKPRRFGSMPKICIKTDTTTSTDGGTYLREGSKTPDSGTNDKDYKLDDNNNNNIIITNPPPRYLQGYGSIAPHYSANPSNNEYLNLTHGMDSRLHLPAPAANTTTVNDNDSTATGVYHLESEDNRHQAQNSGVPTSTADDRSHLSSEATSNKAAASSDHQDSESVGDH